jgi:hypothetical protein
VTNPTPYTRIALFYWLWLSSGWLALYNGTNCTRTLHQRKGADMSEETSPYI